MNDKQEVCVVHIETRRFFDECHGVHHLHQLQNAYYMATGEELDVQPKKYRER